MSIWLDRGQIVTGQGYWYHSIFLVHYNILLITARAIALVKNNVIFAPGINPVVLF